LPSAKRDKAIVRRTYIRGFDGLRGIAASLVVVHHTVIFNTHIGQTAVDVFFALSGYLIMNILLSGRERIEAGTSTIGAELRRFWINRALRIFPVYYLVLIGLFIKSKVSASNPDLTDNIAGYLLYLQNFVIAFKTHHWGIYSQTWSLAIEQQFYILFSALILFVAVKYTHSLLVILYALCVGFVLLAFDKMDGLQYLILPPLSFMFIFIGAWLSERSLPISTGKGQWLPWVTALILLFISFLPGTENAPLLWSGYLPIYSNVMLVILGILCGLMIWQVLNYQESGLVAFLELAPLRFLGKISYALYVVHSPISHLIYAHLSPSHHNLKWFAATYILAVIVATCSLYLLEKPLQKLKKR
jgi:peptidoglycan/LPS O-acetylase OafA/YrhL